MGYHYLQLWQRRVEQMAVGLILDLDKTRKVLFHNCDASLFYLPFLKGNFAGLPLHNISLTHKLPKKPPETT
jgi:hypothetical protein